MDDITILQFLSLSAVLSLPEVCIIMLLFSTDYKKVLKSRAEIARSLNIGVTTVSQSTKTLHTLGIVSVIGHKRGKYGLNSYELNEDRLRELIQELPFFVDLNQQIATKPLLSDFLHYKGYTDINGELDLFQMVLDYPTFQDFCNELKEAPKPNLRTIDGLQTPSFELETVEQRAQRKARVAEDLFIKLGRRED
jgi:hypothetical protein